MMAGGGLIRSAIVAIVDLRHAHTLMLARRDDDRGYPSSRCFPGGRLEGREDPVEAVIRETLEETGLTISNLGHLGTQPSESAHPRHYDVDGFVTCEWAGKLTAFPTPEHQDGRWVPITDVPALTPLGRASRWLAGQLGGVVRAHGASR